MDIIINFIAAHPIELLAALVNFIWIYFEYKASIWLWPVGVILPIFYAYLSWNAHFIGNIVINVYYFVTSLWGWYLWLRKGKAESDAEGIGNIPVKTLSISILTGIPLTAGMYFMFRNYSSLPWADGLATAISFIGMIWMARKYRQHWLCWIIANLISPFVFLRGGDLVSATVYFINAIAAIAGWFNWSRMMCKQQNLQTDLS